MLKERKENVNYRQGTDYERCQLCKHFKLPHSCEVVAGRILHTDLCDLFVKARTPFDYEPDEGGTEDGESNE